MNTLSTAWKKGTVKLRERERERDRGGLGVKVVFWMVRLGPGGCVYGVSGVSDGVVKGDRWWRVESVGEDEVE